jgi:hypothetical protein
MKASASVKAASSVKATEARFPAGRKTSGHTSPVKTSEGPGMEAARHVSPGKSMASRCTVKTSTIEAPATESAPGSIEMFAVIENSAVGGPSAVVEKNAVMPIPSPMAPTPAKSGKRSRFQNPDRKQFRAR